MSEPLDVLREFLKLPHQAQPVLERFAELPGSDYVPSRRSDGFVYIPPARENAVLLIAHADTYWKQIGKSELEEDEKKLWNPVDLLGADDRAGCALLWLFRQSGHGLLVTDGEETGLQGSQNLLIGFPDYRHEIQERYRFLAEFDLRGDRLFKCYNVGTPAFRNYIRETTGFTEAERTGGTDIRILAQKVCAVNFSCGYYQAHSPGEYLVKEEWLHTFRMAEQLLAESELPHFLQS